MEPMQNIKNEEPIPYTIDPSCDIRGIEKMKIGKSVVVQKDCWLNIAYNNPNMAYMIEIGEGSNIGRRSNISASNRIVLGKNVLTAPNVHITDHNHAYKNIGIPIANQGISSIQNEVVIGDGTWLGINSVIAGNVHIGKGCVIGANTVVHRDIPDYCVAVGNPERIVKIFDIESGNWVEVENDRQMLELLEKRKNTPPLISICIPTYNRAKDLETCLTVIYNQISDDPFFEVVVSDNHSNDSTPEIAQRFARQYSNLRYFKNDINLGAERNILKSIKESKGKYFLLHGDDDFFRDGALYAIFNAVNQNRQINLFFLNVLSGNGQINLSNGMDSFLRDTSIYATFISSILIKRSEFDKLEDRERFLGTNLNHVYLLYSMLAINQEYCIINNPIFWHGNNDPKGYNFAEVFIKSYLNILDFFTDKGLSAKTVKADKKRILNTMVYPWYRRILENHISLDVSNFSELFIQYYKDEPYFEEAFNIIKSIRETSGVGL